MGPVDLADMRRSMRKMEEQQDWLLNGLVDGMTLTWQMRLREERRRWKAEWAEFYKND